MPYSQKYCLVSFFNPINTGSEFDKADWPLHITLADVFAVNLRISGIEAKLTQLLKRRTPVKSFLGKETILGTTAVILVDNNNELAKLHADLIDLLELNGAKFNAPEFTGKGFLPHCTIQKTEQLQAGDEINISSIALVDMFPDEKWQQRKIINTFKLQTERTE